MAEKKLHTLQTNEEIIEELTKDFKSTCMKDDKTKSEKGENFESNSSNKDDPWENIGKDPDEDEKEEKSETTENVIDEDLSDEEELKDRDLNLTEEDKKLLQKESEIIRRDANDRFRMGEFETALSMYSQALKICPLCCTQERTFLFANRAAAKSKLPNEKQSAIRDCTKAIQLDPNYVKAYLRRANLYEETEKFDEALEDFKKVLTFDPSHTESNCAIRRLPSLIEQRNEKLKTEMLGKLKDLGNLVLKPFGLSTDNFQLQQDPNSGGYSVKFNQNSS
ncbi:tetratricopeptide repeat protein 1 [Leptopilina heterotoma]|uniref:tetratricopeptide repeat protein 1 n=1 Tax=Leptopilina heterotoma TaxID=63436 RepID=UPI001CAA2E7A|nr:tetratricopeptide repeat protein 1 [Leptopilina heterotoma]XP_043466238.1 tetratricopeptide repeat protein 1 [Leptopilina heterotoma]